MDETVQTSQLAAVHEEADEQQAECDGSADGRRGRGCSRTRTRIKHEQQQTVDTFDVVDITSDAHVPRNSNSSSISSGRSRGSSRKLALLALRRSSERLPRWTVLPSPTSCQAGRTTPSSVCSATTAPRHLRTTQPRLRLLRSSSRSRRPQRAVGRERADGVLEGDFLDSSAVHHAGDAVARRWLGCW